MQTQVTKKTLSVLAALLACLAVAPVTLGQEEEEEKKSTLMSERAFKRLSQAHEALGDQRYGDAIAKLQSMENGMKLSDYERALVLQTYGFVYAQQENYPRAIEYFEQSLATDALPRTAAQGMLYSLAGLYASQQQWQKSIDTMERWLPNEPDPPPDAFILIASAYAEMNRYREALPWVDKAIAKAPKPKENWYQLKAAIQFELKQFRGAAKTCRTMVGLWPEKKTYWEMLAGAYQENGDDFDAMAALELAYRQGILVEERQIKNLVRMKMYLEVPYQAAELMEKELASGRVERSQKNLELLLAAWEAAREFDKAIGVIDQIAPMTGDGKYYWRKAQLFAERNQWDQVVSSAEDALARGGLKDTGKVHLLVGMAEIEQDKLNAAEAAFKRAQTQGGKTAEQAGAWLEFIKDRRASMASRDETAPAEEEAEPEQISQADPAA